MTQRILREWPEDRRDGHPRFRIVHRRTAAKARCWLEATNQKRGGWFWVQNYYIIQVRARVHIESSDGYYDMMPKDVSLQLAEDIHALLLVAP